MFTSSLLSLIKESRQKIFNEGELLRKFVKKCRQKGREPGMENDNKVLKHMFLIIKHIENYQENETIEDNTKMLYNLFLTINLFSRKNVTDITNNYLYNQYEFEGNSIWRNMEILSVICVPEEQPPGIAAKKFKPFNLPLPGVKMILTKEVSLLKKIIATELYGTLEQKQIVQNIYKQDPKRLSYIYAYSRYYWDLRTLDKIIHITSEDSIDLEHVDVNKLINKGVILRIIEIIGECLTEKHLSYEVKKYLNNINMSVLVKLRNRLLDIEQQIPNQNDFFTNLNALDELIFRDVLTEIKIVRSAVMTCRENLNFKRMLNGNSYLKGLGSIYFHRQIASIYIETPFVIDSKTCFFKDLIVRLETLQDEYSNFVKIDRLNVLLDKIKFYSITLDLEGRKKYFNDIKIFFNEIKDCIYAGILDVDDIFKKELNDVKGLARIIFQAMQPKKFDGRGITQKAFEIIKLYKMVDTDENQLECLRKLIKENSHTDAFIKKFEEIFSQYLKQNVLPYEGFDISLTKQWYSIINLSLKESYTLKEYNNIRDLYEYFIKNSLISKSEELKSLIESKMEDKKLLNSKVANLKLNEIKSAIKISMSELVKAPADVLVDNCLKINNLLTQFKKNFFPMFSLKDIENLKKKIENLKYQALTASSFEKILLILNSLDSNDMQKAISNISSVLSLLDELEVKNSNGTEGIRCIIGEIHQLCSNEVSANTNNLLCVNESYQAGFINLLDNLPPAYPLNDREIKQYEMKIIYDILVFIRLVEDRLEELDGYEIFKSFKQAFDDGIKDTIPIPIHKNLFKDDMRKHIEENLTYQRTINYLKKSATYAKLIKDLNIQDYSSFIFVQGFCAENATEQDRNFLLPVNISFSSIEERSKKLNQYLSTDKGNYIDRMYRFSNFCSLCDELEKKRDLFLFLDFIQNKLYRYLRYIDHEELESTKLYMHELRLKRNYDAHGDIFVELVSFSETELLVRYLSMYIKDIKPKLENLLKVKFPHREPQALDKTTDSTAKIVSMLSKDKKTKSANPGLAETEKEKGSIFKHKQLGWNCFDIAVNLADKLIIQIEDPKKRAILIRQRFVEYVIAHKDDISYRQILAPEIKHATALTVTYMMIKDSDEREEVFRAVQLEELFQLSAAIDSNDTYNQYLINKNIEQLLKNKSLLRFPKSSLPEVMRTEELKKVVIDYQNAHENMKPVVKECNQRLGNPEGNYLSYQGLTDYFLKKINRYRYSQTFQMFKKAQQEIFLPCEQRFNDFCERTDIYENYVNYYYGVSKHSEEGGWFAFQRRFLEEESTSMIDIVALFLKRQIIIKDSTDNVVYTSVPPFDEKIEVLYNGSNHFSAIPNTSSVHDRLAI